MRRTSVGGFAIVLPPHGEDQLLPASYLCLSVCPCSLSVCLSVLVLFLSVLARISSDCSPIFSINRQMVTRTLNLIRQRKTCVNVQGKPFYRTADRQIIQLKSIQIK